MQRSLIVILLSIVCGVSAAIGVNRFSPKPPQLTVETRPVFVAATTIRRGSKIADVDVKAVDWPVDLVPDGVVTLKEQAVGHSALTSVTTNEPLMVAKLSEAIGSGFASNTVPKGMRACSIQTNGPSASVAGFVRPGDKVDVLLNLRGTSNDDTGGGSTITLLQSAEILAIDDIMDVDAATVKMWMKEGVRSVTLLVTPEQALQLSLGQAVGTVSLALRNGTDRDFITDTSPVTINQIRSMPAADTYALQAILSELQAASQNRPAPQLAAADASDAEGMDTDTAATNSAMIEPPKVAAAGTGPNDSAVNGETAMAERQPPRQSYIYTMRGNQTGYVRVLGVENMKP